MLKLPWRQFIRLCTVRLSRCRNAGDGRVSTRLAIDHSNNDSCDDHSKENRPCRDCNLQIGDLNATVTHNTCNHVLEYRAVTDWNADVTNLQAAHNRGSDFAAVNRIPIEYGQQGRNDDEDERCAECDNCFTQSGNNDKADQQKPWTLTKDF